MPPSIRHPDELLELVTASNRDPRPCPATLVLVAHPDDEIIALGGRLVRHRRSVFLHVTDGAPSNGADAALHGFTSVGQYRAARHSELTAALDLAGVAPDRRMALGIADQQAAQQLAGICDALAATIARHPIDVIVTHPYEGGHPDHDACAAAARLTADRLPIERRPVIVEAAFYHRGLNGSNGIETGTFLPAPPSGRHIERRLAEDEQSMKRRLLACFTTQRDTLAYFGTARECYRIAPSYDFTQPPHDGALLYEQFDWGITGEEFRQLVTDMVSCR